MPLKRWVTSSGPYVAQTAALCVVVFAALQLWRFDFHVQFNYLGDSLWYAVLAKSIVQNGWTYFVPQLSAPYGLHAAAFPSMTNFDWLVMKCLGVFIADPAVVFNVFWLLTIVVTAWTCLFSLRILGVPAWLAALGGVVYTCIPYTWMRSTSHLSLVFYTVPLLCAFAVYLVRGPVPPWTDATYRRAGLLGALVQGFNYVYFSWFAVLLFALAAVLGYACRRRRDIIARAGLAISVIGIAAALNLAPSFYAWQKHGKPDIGYKTPAEAEVYGLKIRHLLLPHNDNPLPPLRWWAARDRKAAFPNENENGTARLGLIGAMGFLLLLGVSLRSRSPADAEAETMRTVAALNLAVLVITTVGGFGAIINTITVPDIRGYNRFSVFIAFFAIAGLSLWLARRLRHAQGMRQAVIVGGVVAVAGFSLYDQVLDAKAITDSYGRDKGIAADVDAVVGRMPTVFEENTAVFEYPITDFPADFNRGRMLAYDHSLPYLRSDHFRWSWPSLTPRQTAWSRFIASLRGENAVRALAAAGFGAVWIDRYGYRDNGAAISAAVASAGGVEVLAGASRRYAVFDIRGVARR
jgi:phosphoglycerol transferase